MSDQPTLRTLLRRPDLRLRLISTEGSLHDGALDRAMRWVHGSDLTDPTPFLADDLALLTTGSQFTDTPGDIDDYVSRLADRGIVALGFGTEVHRDGVPDGLIAACAAHSIPLFEVPYRTPFIAVARAHSEAIAAQAYARRTWALDAQRALALAALKPRGLEATLAELSRRLDAWVGLFDVSGTLSQQHPSATISAETHTELSDRADDVLVRGLESGQTLTIGEQCFMLFSLGRGGHLRGVLALGTAHLDPEARAVVTSVIAMAGLALEQSEQLTRSRRRLHSQLLGSLLDDDPSLARRVLGSLPAGPIMVAVTADAPRSALADWWEHRRIEQGTVVFLAESADGVTVCISASDAALFDAAAARFHIRLGVSEPESYTAFSRAHAQALTVLRQSDEPGAFRFADTVAHSIITALATDEARLVAESRLTPLRAHDAVGGELERSLRVWLEHDARFDPAASALGIHRHTLRARITQAAGLLATDLSSFPARAELWTALQTARD